LGTLGGGKDMMETRVERTEWTLLLMTYFWVILICTHRDTVPPHPTLLRNWGLSHSPAKTRSLLLKMLRNSTRDCNVHYSLKKKSIGSK
jgi:hypothetical protein